MLQSYTMPSHRSEKKTNFICTNCPAAYALGRYESDPETGLTEKMSTIKRAMAKNEAQVAMDALNAAAGRIACHTYEVLSTDLPAEVPPLGSPELIRLVSQCPSFPEYVHSRTRQ